jgi:hypothetical protein
MLAETGCEIAAIILDDWHKLSLLHIKSVDNVVCKYSKGYFTVGIANAPDFNAPKVLNLNGKRIDCRMVGDLV